MVASNSPINLACGADERYAAHMAVMLTSVLKHKSTHELNIYIFDGGLSTQSRASIERILCTEKGVKVNWVCPDLSLLSQLKVTGHLSTAAYLRLLIPNALPENIEKVLYLDCDLVVEHGLGSLWDTDLRRNALGAVQDMSVPYVGSPRGLQSYRKRGLRASHPYFNSGVLLINLSWWREHDVSARAFSYIRGNHDEVTFCDQDGLNYVLAEKWKPLDRRWNVPPKVMNYDSWENTEFKRSISDNITELQTGPYIIHYIGSEKPWTYGKEVTWQDRYFHYLRESEWFENEWSWQAWRLKTASKYYLRRLGASSSGLISGMKRRLVPVARMLGVARSSRK